ncbi:MAG: hypothetical protein KF705_16565 [Phycisphaeraceae bacterium]|nr:hypothetical protein [Phycisphaeraceae bacterium]
MSLSPTLIWNAVAIALGEIGGALFLWAMFWDKPRGRLRCPKCWYDMKGAVEAKAEGPWTCSECGRVSRTERRLRRTKKRKLIATLATTLILLVLYGWTTRDRVIARGWIGAVPTMVLVSIPAGYDKWSSLYLNHRFDGTPPVQSGSIKHECMRRYLAGGMRAPHMWVWRRTLQADFWRAGCGDLVEQDLSAHAESRGSDDPQCGAIQRSFVLRPVLSRGDRANWPQDRLLNEWRFACDEVAKQPLSMNSWAIGFPRGDPSSMSLHIAMARESLFVGPRCAMLRLSQFDAALRVAATAPSLIPSRSAHDLSALRELEAIPCDTTSDGDVSLDDASTRLERLTGRSVRFTRASDRPSKAVDMTDAHHAADLCDRIAHALRPSPGYDMVLWTISDHEIEFFMPLERPCMLEPRVYSIEELLDKRLPLDSTTTNRTSEREALLQALRTFSFKQSGVGSSDDRVVAIGSWLVVNATATTHARVARFLMEYAEEDHERNNNEQRGQDTGR